MQRGRRLTGATTPETLSLFSLKNSTKTHICTTIELTTLAYSEQYSSHLNVDFNDRTCSAQSWVSIQRNARNARNVRNAVNATNVRIASSSQ